jgi:quinoprotein glucose dehydrogenase
MNALRRLAVAAFALAVACHTSKRLWDEGGLPRDFDARHSAAWADYGGGADQSKFIAISQITKANVAHLAQAWIYPTSDSVAYQFNPIIVDSVMYVMAKNNSLVALNAKTGKELWIHADLRAMTRRGVSYWESRDRSDRRLVFTTNNYLQEIDAKTGLSIRTFGDSGIVDLREGLGRDPSTIARVGPTTPGRIVDNLLILGSSTGEDYLSSPGHIRAYDVRTGKLAWVFHTIPHPGEFGYDTWPKEAYRYIGGVNAWGEMSVVGAGGHVYQPPGAPTKDKNSALAPGGHP